MTPPLPKDGWYPLWQAAKCRFPISFHSTAAISLSMRREITSENASRLYHLARGNPFSALEGGEGKNLTTLSRL
jgi:hypothetical protein